MAGVFTDNQPDFAFLAPGETKVFCQFWYPFRDVGPVDRARPRRRRPPGAAATRTGTTARTGASTRSDPESR